ncbi:hypothetical protein GCM10027262_61470 [Nocardia tengchongensis]
MPGNTIRLFIELSVGHRVFTRNHSHRIGIRDRQQLRQDPRRHGRAPRRGHQPGLLAPRQHIHATHRQVGTRHHRIEDPIQPHGPFLDSLPIEQICGVVDPEGDIASRRSVFGDGDDNVHLRRLRPRIQDLDREFGQLQPWTVHVLENEVHLAQRCVRDRSPGIYFIDNPFVRKVAVGKRIDVDVLDPPQKLEERFIGTHFGT